MTPQSMRILFLDVETDGLPTRLCEFSPVGWPHIVQAAWIVSNGEGRVLRSACRIVKPEGFIIPAEAVEIHGITTEMALRDGTDPRRVLYVLNREVDRADLVVIHNVDFDANVLASESLRFSMPSSILRKPSYCTMKGTTELMKLPFPDGSHSEEWKWPRLQELHEFLFGYPFDGAHDAGADVRACYDCFWELVRIGWA